MKNFLFFLTFFYPTPPRNRKILRLTFFSEIPTKSAQKSRYARSSFIFYKLRIFRRDHGNTHTPTHTHTLFFGPIMRKERAYHHFLESFFCSLLLLLSPKTHSNHLFRQISDRK